MYEKNILIKGKHATYMKELVSTIDSNIASGIFKRNLDVYLIAPIVGKVYGRKVSPDSGDDSTSIHVEQLLGASDELDANFRTIILLEDKEKLDTNQRVDRAFKYDRDEEKRKPYDEVMNQYILGGIEILHEKIIEDAKSTDDIVMNLFSFFMDFDDRYRDLIDFDELENLCKKSGK